MRIVQLSDIHLSADNLDNLRNFYLEALINDLKAFPDGEKINVILITGDLVDRGGVSLGTDPYAIFDQEFIQPIVGVLQLRPDQILFIPGNHDISLKDIEEENEFYLKGKLNKEMANAKLKEMQNGFVPTNRRIQQFKEFEQRFHASSAEYVFSNNESLSIQFDGGYKVGFALINDSWRCSGDLKSEEHFIGVNQLFQAKHYFNTQKTDLNIAVFHHPVEFLNRDEAEEVLNILKSQKFDFAFFGHKHEHQYDSVISSAGGIISINGRSAFSDASENSARYQPGYHILDIDIIKNTYVLYARKFIKNRGYRFDKDTDSLEDGKQGGVIESSRLFALSSPLRNVSDKELPLGYKADVDQIVKLLIGKSLYPNQLSFVRELIQNSVDACTRKKEKHPDTTPNIIVNVNTVENYFEVYDEGDGMSKRILREHFAVIGKSLSQELDKNTFSGNMIAQFGIGFISAFIVAEKVCISTKYESEDRINVEITDVFKGFKYIFEENYLNKELAGSGTLVRVYLKNGIPTLNLINVAHSYCRHIDNLQLQLNGLIQDRPQGWATESGTFEHQIKDAAFEARFVIGLVPRGIISSNGGFLINAYPQQLVPFKFPAIIGGEINIVPGSVDLDLSRSSIIDSAKSVEIKKKISLTLRSFFQQVLDSSNQQLKQLVGNYLQAYLSLISVPNHQQEFGNSYTDFYSKRELIQLCAQLLKFKFDNEIRTFEEIINLLNEKKVNKIYYLPQNSNEFQILMGDFLTENGNLIFSSENNVVNFRDTALNVNTLQTINLICREYRFQIIDLTKGDPVDTNDIILSPTTAHDKIGQAIAEIEQEFKIQIGLIRFKKSPKPFILFGSKFLLNLEHPSLQKLTVHQDKIDLVILKAYIEGILNLLIQQD